MKGFHRIGLIINVKTLIIAGLSVGSTLLAQHHSITADLPLTLMATAVVFPIVFSIGGAYKRRELALDHYGNLKAHGRALHLVVRDWFPEEPNKNLLSQSLQRQKFLFESMREVFGHPVSELREREQPVYDAFSALSRHIRDLRVAGIGSSEISRCNQYLSKMMIAFEQIKHIFQYRTPITLRAFSSVFIVVLPVVYGPYFATLATNAPLFLTALSPALFSLVLVALDNVQDHLENPFDQVGEDDIVIRVEKFLHSLEGCTAKEGAI